MSDQHEYGVRELSTSLIRFSNALATFSVQQMQDAMGAMTDSKAMLTRVCQTLDSLSDSLSGQIDPSRNSTLDSITRTGTEMMDRTIEAVNVQALNARGVMDTTAAFVRRTTDTMAEMIRKPGVTGFRDDLSAR